MRIDGSGRQQLTDTRGICDPTDWSPDGATLAVTCDPDGNGRAPHDLYLLEAAGGALVPILSDGFDPKFTPAGDALIYRDDAGAMWRLALGGEGTELQPVVRSPIELPRIEANWDIHFFQP